MLCWEQLVSRLPDAYMSFRADMQTLQLLGNTFIVEKGIITKNEKMDEDLPDGSSICYVISRLQYKG